MRFSRTLRALAVVGLVATAGGCASMGPVAGMTMASVVPNDRAGGEIQVASVPGYYLSDAVKDRERGKQHLQVSGFFDPGDLLPVQGFGLGLRWVGPADDGYLEPMVRYRFHLDKAKRAALGVVGYFTRADGSAEGASYEMTRGGLELGLDVLVTPPNRWAELHLTGGASLTGLYAEGTYCMNADDGYARDCDEGEVGDTGTEVAGAYPSAFAGITLDLFTGVPILHGLRVGAYLAGGTRPSALHGDQSAALSWFSWGLNVSLGIGAW